MSASLLVYSSVPYSRQLSPPFYLTFIVALIFPNCFLSQICLTLIPFLPHFWLLLELILFQDHWVFSLWKEGSCSFVFLLETKLLHIRFKARPLLTSSSLILLHVMGTVALKRQVFLLVKSGTGRNQKSNIFKWISRLVNTLFSGKLLRTS